jgi:hypothetical protein
LKTNEFVAFELETVMVLFYAAVHTKSCLLPLQNGKTRKNPLQRSMTDQDVINKSYLPQ